MKKIWGYLLGAALIVNTTTLTYAGEIKNLNIKSPVINNAVNSKSIFQIQPRGQVISTGVLEISNPENGEIGVYIQTLTHIKDIDKTTLKVYLDRRIESENRWANVDSYSFTYTKEDNPDEDLSMMAVSFNIVGQPVDCVYRLRGVHIVDAGSIHETLSSETDGIMITKN